MKYFLIQYRFKDGAPDEWRQEIARFIAELDSDPDLKGKISYRCLKSAKDTSYYHLAGAADEKTVKIMQGRDFFKRYAAGMKAVAGGEVEVSPLEVIAETL